jgi:hypothetical protein
MKKFKKIFFTVLLASLVIYVFGFNWSFVFKKRIVGEIVAVERVNDALIVAGANQPINSQVFSFSVGIKDLKSGEIHMSSSEDRQWAAVQKGNCVVAAYFPYPPWMLSKANTNHNARLLRNFVSCDQMSDQSTLLSSILFFFLIT